MTTPQPSGNAALFHPSSASKRASAAVNAATPAGPASAPRSIHSPAAVRGSGKTPAGGAGFKMGGTPMTLSLSGMGTSPFTPGAAGLAGSGFTPGGAMMIPSMSDMGLGSSKRSGSSAEVERRRKMREVLRRIGRVSGAVSEEGICRISRRVGLQNDVDAEGEEVRRRLEGERVIGIAGKDVLIEVDMKGGLVRSVVVQGLGGVEEEERERAGRVLEGLIVGEERSLEGFGRELGRVAGLDRVGERGVSAFEAISGVGHSLKRLFERECQVEGGDVRRVLRKRSGRPWMHSRGRVGWGLDYWTSIPPAPPKDDNAMDLDSQQEEENVDPSDFRTLHLTAETCPASLYPPVRISADWLAEDLSSVESAPAKTENNGLLLNNSNNSNIPWQDPPPTYTTPPPEEDPTSATQLPKLPDLRFLATLSPPLILPYSTATQLLAELAGEGVQQMVVREWHSLLLDDAGNNVVPANSSGVFEGAEMVWGKDEVDRKYLYRTAISKEEWGVKITELPFAHPRMVVNALPVLRQWCVFGELAREVLTSSAPASELENGRGKDEERDLLDDLLASDSNFQGSGEENNVRVTVEISTTPNPPTLSISFPIMIHHPNKPSREEVVARIIIQVMRNGEIHVPSCEGFAQGGAKEEGKEGEEDVKGRLARGLEICGELGVWIEWIRGGGWKKKGM